IIAIDFGTSYSGYCFSLASGKDQILQVYWGTEHGFKNPKVPMGILFNQKQEFKYFGYDPVMKYKSLPSSQADSRYFFQNFKMQLYNMNIIAGMELKATNGNLLPALTVFSKSLCYLKEHALNTLKEVSLQTAYDQEITWVITVPAIWSAAAKQLVCLVAKEAGIISDMISRNLIIALEPEAASLWCKQL
ncbi:HS12B protein, partial [Erythrocercus mccallii]|nr:HS12B protein [Erythrocercus mccallii]